MLIGNVGKDPEIRHLEGGVSVATLTLATSERYRDRNGEMQEQTEWHNVVLWRGLADVAERYVRKGTQVYIEGKIRTRSWEDQSGQKRYTTEILANSLQLLGKKSDNPATSSPLSPKPAGTTAASVATPSASQSNLSANLTADDVDDLPF